jgi:Big-like domain-containing protein
MHSLSRVLRLATLAVLLLLALPSCTDQTTFSEPPAQPLYTTPTGLVTANPPAIVAGAGDISTCGNNNDEATAKLLDAIPGTVITMGDNVMPNGTTAEFASCYDPTWGRHKGRTRPAAGNHDYNTSGAAGYFAYFGAAAGDPGKGYYGYELGAWHVIVLNSNISSSAGSAQDIWLKADLAAHPNQCILSYYHHPLYSSTGGSGTGGAIYSGVRNLFTDLYAGHADLVLNGHRHFYERIAPMKPDGTADPVNGVREIISGTGGDGGGTLTNIFPLSEVRNGSTFGVLKLYLYDDSYAWKFVPVAGKTFTDSGQTACHASGGGGGGGGGGVSATNSTIAASPSSFTAGSGSATIIVVARDEGNNAIAGASVTLAASGSGNSLSPGSGMTDATGAFTSTFTSTTPETKTIAATIGGTAIIQTASVTVEPTSGGGGGSGPIAQQLLTSGASGANQRIYTTAAIAPAANALVTIAIRMRRSSGALTPALSGGGMTAWTEVAHVDYDPVTSPTSRLIVFRALSPTPGSGPVTITFTNSISNVEWAVSQWTGVDQSGTNGSGAIAQTGSTRGDATSSLSTTLAAFGNAGDVAFGVVGATTAAPAVTPGSGFAELVEIGSGESTLLETEAGTGLNTVAATLTRPANAGLLAIELAAGGASGPTISATQSSITATSPIAAGSGTSTITATLRDESGSPVSGVSAVLTASGSGNTLTQPGPTGGDGIATGVLRATVAGSKTITATAGGVTLDQHPVVIVTPGPVDASRSTLGASPASITAGSGTAAITATIVDAYGNPISGSAVSLEAPGTNVVLGTPSGFTGPDGVFTSTLSSADPQVLTVTASADGAPLTHAVTVTVTPPGSAGTIVHTLLTAGHDPLNLRVYTTGTIAPAPGALVTVAVLTHQASAAAPSPTLTGGGMAQWDVVASVTFNGSTPLDRLTVYRALSVAPGSGPITITSSVTVSNCQWIVSQWEGVADGGSNGAAAIVQAVQNSGTGVNGLTAMLAPFVSPNDVGYGAFGVASAVPVITAASGFTAIDQQPSGESTTGDLFAEWGQNQTAVAASWPAKSGGGVALEIMAKQ